MALQRATRTIEQARAEVTGKLSKLVLEYVSIYERTAASAKQPGFSCDEWDALTRLIAVDEFERVGAQQEIMDWPAYRARLTEFASKTHWKGTFRRISELSGVVFLELIEEMTRGDEVEVVNSLTVYEFNGDDKLRHFDCYLQRRVDGKLAVYPSNRSNRFIR